jgi:hypothetical protein
LEGGAVFLAGPAAFLAVGAAFLVKVVVSFFTAPPPLAEGADFLAT